LQRNYKQLSTVLRPSTHISIFIHQHIGRTCKYDIYISWKTNTK